MFEVREAGSGPAVLLVHGAAEDAGMLDGLGHALAERGFRALWYDRRGTGGSTRFEWPGGGADQHAADAAALLRERGAVGATVLGFSSGAVVALALAARHPEVASRVIAWEPAALGVLDGGAEMHAAIMAPIEEFMVAHPGDWEGAFEVMMTVISGGQADLSSPQVKAMSANAEAALRDDGPLITLRPFAPADLRHPGLTIAMGQTPDPMHARIAVRLAGLAGRSVLVVPGADDHEIYIANPAVLADWLASDPQLARKPARSSSFHENDD